MKKEKQYTIFVYTIISMVMVIALQYLIVEYLLKNNIIKNISNLRDISNVIFAFLYDGTLAIAGILLFRLITKQDWNSFGLKFKKNDIIFTSIGLAILILMHLIFTYFTSLLNLASWNYNFSNQIVPLYLLYAVLTRFLFVGIGEELFFRGFLFKALKSYGNIVQYGVNILIFVSIHFIKLEFNLLYLLQLISATFLLCFIYDKSGSIWPGIIIHGAMDLIATLFFLNLRGVSIVLLNWKSHYSIGDAVQLLSIIINILLIILIWFVYGYKFKKIEKYSNYSVFALIIILTLTSCGRGMPISETKLELNKGSMDIYNEALALVDRLKYKEARKLLEDGYETIKDNDKVLNLYGLWEFHIFQNHEKAKELYKRAIKLNPEYPENYLSIGYVYETKGHYKKAIDYYEEGAKSSVIYENVPLNPMLAIAYKNIGNCYLKLNDTEKAILSLEKASENNPFSIEVNALLHKLYVETEEYEKAYTVWRNDNLIDESEDHVYKGILEWNRLYKHAVDNNNSTDHVQMANLYETIVLYDEAAIEYEKALAQNSTNKDIKNKYEQVKSFLLFRDELRVLLDDYYRDRCINGDLEEQNFYKRIEPAYKKIAVIFPEIKDNSSSTITWITTLNREIEKKFNVRIKIIKANGSMLGLHFGRIIDSSMIHSDLWGKEIDLKVVTLKNMTSNGLDYWRTMNTIGVGGWSESETEIVRVILNSENDNILQLASLYNKDVRESLIKDFIANHIEKEERVPLELYFSPKIKVELVTRQIDIEIEKAKNKGISENELQRYLFDKIQKNFIVKTNIFIHESQHSADSKFGFSFKASWEREYRPKLSQLAYGDMPFSSLNQFYNSSIGEEVNNTHLMANTQIFKDIVQYIYDNHEKFPQIEIQNNILAQLTKLSEDDLRVIAIKIFERNYGRK